jgi:hypothetical protein
VPYVGGRLVRRIDDGGFLPGSVGVCDRTASVSQQVSQERAGRSDQHPIAQPVGFGLGKVQTTGQLVRKPAGPHRNRRMPHANVPLGQLLGLHVGGALT